MPGLPPIARLFAIIWAALRFIARSYLRRDARDDSKTADDLKQTFEGLGTTFVKLGQLLSIRRDLIADVYVDAFQQLQDRVPPFPSVLARGEIEQTLNAPIGTLFSSFDDEPLAAASIAQVHAAVLPDGREVIVKVRRPGVVAQVSRDMRLLRWVVRTMSPLSATLRQIDPMALVDELEENLHRELDFRHEAQNVRRFELAFKDSDTVYVPALIPGYASESVLVQIRSRGMRLGDPRIQSRGQAFANHFVEAYVFQFFSLGVFHGDPHPGNLFFLEDGRICFHDYGLVGFIDRRTRLGLANFVQALVNLDAEWLLDAYLDLGILGGEVHRQELEAALEDILEDYAALPMKEWSFAEAFLRVARLGRGKNLRLPHSLLVMMRAVFLMENVVATLDPDYVLVEGLQQTARQIAHAAPPDKAALARLRAEAGMLANDMPRLLIRLMRASRSGWDGRYERRGSSDERPTKRIAISIVILGVLVSWTLFTLSPGNGSPPFIAVVVYLIALWLVFRR